MEVARLHTLGSVYATGADGAPLAGAAAQRRTLALLCVLAVAGDAGVSRDKLVGILWPESDTERARHSLTQGMYAARRALRSDDLFATGADIRLNGARLASDVQEFEAAAAAGDLERAAKLYEGPFLDGFFVSGAAEFERWASAQRDRLEARAREVLDALASAAEARGDTGAVVQWRRKLAGLAPFDGAVTARLMEALVAAGDRAGALQQARVHESLLREHLDLGPDPLVAALASRLRTEPSGIPVSVVAVGSNAPTPATGQSHREEVVTPAEVDSRMATSQLGTAVSHPGTAVSVLPPPIATLAPPTRGRRWWVVPLVGAFGMAMIAAGVVIGRSRTNESSIAALRSPQKVVVAPFRVAGAAASLGYLRDGMVELLSARLADDSAARSVDAGAVLEAWRVAGVASNVDVPRETVVRLAHRLGAERVVVGSIVGTPARMIVRASVISTPTGVVSADATVIGSADSLASVVDRLAAHLLAAEANEDERLASLTSASLPALRAYLAGQAALHARDFRRAAAQYEAALTRDPGFALAGLRLASAAERLFDLDRMRRGLTAAWRSRDALSERDQALLVAYVGTAFPAPSTMMEQVSAWRHLIDLAPRRANAWFEQGVRLFHEGALAGIADPRARAQEVFERALTIDRVHAPSIDYLALLDAGAPGSGSDYRRGAREWRAAASSGDERRRASVRSTMAEMRADDLVAIAMMAQFDATGIADAEQALSILAKRTETLAEEAALTVALHAVASNRGRPDEAARLSARLRRLQPGSHAGVRLRILDGIFGDGDRVVAAAAAAQLDPLTMASPTSQPTTSSTWGADVCTLAEWRLSRGDTAGVAAVAAALRGRPDILPAPMVGTAPLVCAELLEGWLAVLTRRPDAAAHVQRLDSLVLSPQVAGDAVVYAPLLIADLHLRLGDTTRALAALRRRSHMAGWPRYLAVTLRREAELAARTADVAGASEALSRYLALRDAPEPSLAGEARNARRDLARLAAPDTAR